MSTVIYPSPIFGPIHSRRLGVSLGINLMPDDGKVCTFDCIYCECGFNADNRPHHHRPEREEVKTVLETQLKRMMENGPKPDVLTFAGNGEPTAHPEFKEIVEDTIELRNQYCPNAKVSVLSNATLIDRQKVFDTLMMVDNNILKLDTVSMDYINRINRPLLYYNVREQIERMKAFKGHIIIQTMFMNCLYGGEPMADTSEEYIAPWLDAIKEIGPQEVMIYTIDRETPNRFLQKASHEELDAIVKRIEALGIPATASY